MKIEARKMIEPGFEVPFFYGVAWHDPQRRAAICYPMPFNWIARFFRWIYYEIKLPNRLAIEIEFETMLAERYKKGFDDGEEVGKFSHLNKNRIERDKSI